MRGAGAGRAGETAILRQFQHPLEARAGRAQSQDRRGSADHPAQGRDLQAVARARRSGQMSGDRRGRYIPAEVTCIAPHFVMLPNLNAKPVELAFDIPSTSRAAALHKKSALTPRPGVSWRTPRKAKIPTKD